MILDEFKRHLNPSFIDVTVLYVLKDGDNKSSDVINDVKEVEQYQLEDKIFSPMFYIDMVLGDVPVESNYHEENSEQSNNWSGESIKFDLIKSEFDKLSSFLEVYKDDFFISLETSGGLMSIKKERRINSFIVYDKQTKERGIIGITISLIMKDYFEYDQIK